MNTASYLHNLFTPLADVVFDDMCNEFSLYVSGDPCNIFTVFENKLYFKNKPPIGIYNINVVAEDLLGRYKTQSAPFTINVEECPCSFVDPPPPPPTTTTSTSTTTTTTTTTTPCPSCDWDGMGPVSLSGCDLTFDANWQKISDHVWTVSLYLDCAFPPETLTFIISCDESVGCLGTFDPNTCATKWSGSGSSSCGTFSLSQPDGSCTNNRPPLWQWIWNFGDGSNPCDFTECCPSCNWYASNASYTIGPLPSPICPTIPSSPLWSIDSSIPGATIISYIPTCYDDLYLSPDDPRLYPQEILDDIQALIDCGEIADTPLDVQVIPGIICSGVCTKPPFQWPDTCSLLEPFLSEGEYFFNQISEDFFTDATLSITVNQQAPASNLFTWNDCYPDLFITGTWYWHKRVEWHYHTDFATGTDREITTAKVKYTLFAWNCETQTMEDITALAVTPTPTSCDDPEFTTYNMCRLDVTSCNVTVQNPLDYEIYSWYLIIDTTQCFFTADSGSFDRTFEGNITAIIDTNEPTEWWSCDNAAMPPNTRRIEQQDNPLPQDLK